jgi:Mn2+/Fe2+ NRAMP family transporter
MKGTRLLKILGPGLLLAGAAVGVSHIVQATRAGADYGFALLGFLLLACLTKWPFLEFGPRYVAATGENLIEGYRRLGRWAIVTYVLVTLGTMFVITATVTMVTAGLAANLFRAELTTVIWSAIILSVCGSLLAAGRYPLLDLLMKMMVVLLGATTIAAVAAALLSGPVAAPAADLATPSIWAPAGVAFLLAMMGWMPIPIDSAVWHTLWRQSRDRQSGHRATVKESLTDYNIGYGIATILGVIFLTLGAIIMFRSGETWPGAPVAFAERFISMYVATLGQWSLPVISIAAFVTMFSTTLVVMDAYPRVMDRLVAQWRGEQPRRTGSVYLVTMAVFALVALGILQFAGPRLLTLVDFATVLSFLTAPIFAFMNYRVVTSPHMPEEARPGIWMRTLSWASMIFLLGFSLMYAYWQFFAR